MSLLPLRALFLPFGLALAFLFAWGPATAQGDDRVIKIKRADIAPLEKVSLEPKSAQNFDLVYQMKTDGKANLTAAYRIRTQGDKGYGPVFLHEGWPAPKVIHSKPGSPPPSWVARISSLNDLRLKTDKGDDLSITVSAEKPVPADDLVSMFSGLFGLEGKRVEPGMLSDVVKYMPSPDKVDFSKGLSLSMSPDGKQAAMGWAGKGKEMNTTFWLLADGSFLPKGDAEGCPTSGDGRVEVESLGNGKATGTWEGSNGDLMSGYFKYGGGVYSMKERLAAVAGIGQSRWCTMRVGRGRVISWGDSGLFSSSVKAAYFENGTEMASITLSEDTKAEKLFCVSDLLGETKKPALVLIGTDKGKIMAYQLRVE